MPSLIITGKNFRLTPPIKQYVTKKMSKLTRMSSLRITESKVELDFDTNQKSGLIYRTEMSVQLPGTILKAGQKAHNMRAAIDLCVPKLMEQVRKYKDKNLSIKKQHHQPQNSI
jgi:ribosomal subunit interface protein